MAETLYATSHITGDCPSPTNANGAPDEVWAGPTGTNTGWTSRWAMGDPSGALSGTQTVTVRVRTNGAGGAAPTVAVNLYENGTLVQSILGITTVSSAGEDQPGNFDGSVITNAADVEIEVVGGVGGGPPGSRASLQLDGVTFTAEVSSGPTPLSDSDAGTGSESGTLAAELSDSDSGTGSEVTALAALLTDSDSGIGGETGSAEEGGGSTPVSDTDTGTGAELAWTNDVTPGSLVIIRAGG